MILISSLILSVEDGNTIASTEVYGADKKTYINIGSGNVFKLHWHWETSALTSDIVDHYNLVIKRHDTVLNVYYDIFDKNVGLVKEFFVDSPMLPALPEQYKLSIYLVAYYKSGSAITSNVVTPYISKGNGTYVKVKPAGYMQPIMKRAIAFANAPALDNPVQVLIKTEAGEPVSILNDEGNNVQVIATRVLESINGWSVLQEGYTKDATGTWHTNDIKFEVLVDETGEIIIESNNEPIYVL